VEQRGKISEEEMPRELKMESKKVRIGPSRERGKSNEKVMGKR
jgi:hypothetical protein